MRNMGVEKVANDKYRFQNVAIDVLLPLQFCRLFFKIHSRFPLTPADSIIIDLPNRIAAANMTLPFVTDHS